MLEKWRPTSSAEGALLETIDKFCVSHPTTKVRISFCPSHCGVAPNELVDTLIGWLCKSAMARSAAKSLPPMMASHQNTKEATKRRLEADEDAWLPMLIEKCASESAKTLSLLGASRANIRSWMSALRNNRPAQSVLLRIVSNSACFWRGTQLSCPHCNTPLTAIHLLAECSASMDDREDALFALGIQERLTPKTLSSDARILPTLVTALFPTLS